MFKIARALLGADGGVNSGTVNTIVSKAYTQFKEIFNVVLPVILGILALIGVIFGIKLGIDFAKAEDANARDEAKKRLVNFIIGIGVALVVGAVLLIIVNSDLLKNLFVVNE